MVVCLEQGASLHMAQLMPLPLTVSCFSKIQIGFTFLVPALLGSPGKRAVKRVCVCVCSSQVIGCVEWGVKLYSNQPTDSLLHGPSVIAELVNLILCYINIYSLTGFLVVGLWIGFDFRLF